MARHGTAGVASLGVDRHGRDRQAWQGGTGKGPVSPGVVRLWRGRHGGVGRTGRGEAWCGKAWHGRHGNLSADNKRKH